MNAQKAKELVKKFKDNAENSKYQQILKEIESLAENEIEETFYGKRNLPSELISRLKSDGFEVEFKTSEYGDAHDHYKVSWKQTKTAIL